MSTKINKALDVNKLHQEHKKGKLLKKELRFPLYAPIKYDGNYIVVLVDRGQPTFHTSGGLEYTHTDEQPMWQGLPDNAYFAERIWGEGKLGDRNRCNLKGSKSAQTSTGHNYKVFGVVSLESYYDGHTTVPYDMMATTLIDLFEPNDIAGIGKLIKTQEELDKYLDIVVKQGYEGIMCIAPKWKWADTKSRGVKFAKYKKRPTVDLLCVAVLAGTGKYEGMIGSLRLQDSSGRIVDVGSGMSDEDRTRGQYFVGKVVEMFYEQIHEGGTYIQPTFGSEYEGVLVREDKAKEDID